MIPRTAREAALRKILDTMDHIPEEASEEGSRNTLDIVACCFLVGIERQACEALKAISAGEGIGMFRTTEITPAPAELRDTRTKTVVAILDCARYFKETFESREMLGMLNLLAGLAVDDSAGEMYQIIAPLVVEAARHASTWPLLERDFPAVCRLIEKEWTAPFFAH
jgi:hypothetical protein